MNYFHERKNAYLHNTSKVTPKNNLVESSTPKDIFSPHEKRYFLCTRKNIFSLHTQKDIFSPQAKSDRIICLEKEGVVLHIFFFKENSI